jgi:hypothetical protein
MGGAWAWLHAHGMAEAGAFFALIGLLLLLHALMNLDWVEITRPANLPGPTQRVLTGFGGLAFIAFGSLFVYCDLFVH